MEYLFPESFDLETMRKQRADVPFADCVMDMLNALSHSLMKDKMSRIYPDVVTFAFFCRKANLLKLKSDYSNDTLRLGRGLVFHIAPANVPVNFGYSLVAGLLSGNSNIVRVSSKSFPQVDLVIKHLAEVAKGYPVAKERVCITRYDHTGNTNEYFSSVCNVRVIWGGDKTIAKLRECPLPARSFDICFADRYSMAVLNADRLVEEPDVMILAEKFYNDTYLFDQNACSAPHLVVWTGSATNVNSAKQMFWNAVNEYTREHYANFQDVMAVDKLTAMYRQAVNMDIRDECFETNVLRRVELPSLPDNIDEFRCAGGYFSEYTAQSLDELKLIIKDKYQTLAYYGFERSELEGFVIRNRIVGIDRIVPLGETATFNLTWDGYDLINQLTRTVSII